MKQYNLGRTATAGKQKEQESTVQRAIYIVGDTTFHGQRAIDIRVGFQLIKFSSSNYRALITNCTMRWSRRPHCPRIFKVTLPHFCNAHSTCSTIRAA